MRLKDGVNMLGVNWRLRQAMIEAERVYDRFGVELVITSLNDGRHGYMSFHYFGLAMDLRTRDFKDKKQSVDATLVLKDELRSINPYFDVVLERNHIHVEFDIKRAEIHANRRHGCSLYSLGAHGLPSSGESGGKETSPEGDG